MPIKGTVQVQISQVQALEMACWLSQEYRPDPAQPLVPAGWSNQQIELASEISAMLDKGARRKRSSLTFELSLPRERARWLASFYKPEGWWDFDGVLLPGQPAPQPIQAIAALFLRASSKHKGRPLLTLLDTVRQEERGVKAGADSRVLRRLRNETKPEREWTKEETDAAGPEPES